MTVKPEVTENTVKNQETEVKPQIQAQSEPKLDQESQEQINWKKFREERKKEREEKEQIAKRAAEKEAEAAALKAAMEAMLSKPTPQAVEEEDEEERKIERKIQAELEKREAQRQLEQKKKEVSELPVKLTSTFPDYYKVCTQENLDYLEYHHPEIANALSYMPDGFDKWASVYKTVKKFIPNPETQKDQKKMDKNSLKPKSMSAGLSSTGDQAPVYLDDAKRAANWERMQKVMRGG